MYEEARAYLTMEQWKTIPGFSFYQVSSTGDVRGLYVSRGGHLAGRMLRKSPRICKAHTDRDGYKQVHIVNDAGEKRWVRVHRAVLLAFVGPCPEGYIAAHLDGSKDNNVVENLQWVTHKENQAHSFAHGTHILGETVPISKLKSEEVLAIWELRGKMPQRKVGRLFGVSKTNIRDIWRGRIWSHVTGSVKVAK